MSREMKHSGIEWIGDIPKEWKTISFSNGILRMSTGLNPRDNFELSKDDEYYYVTIKNFKDGKIYLDDNCDRISKQAWRIIQERSQLEKGDILFASISKDGQAYILEEPPVNWNINESVFCIRTNHDYFFDKYFYYHIIDSQFYNDLRLDATGTTFQSIKQNKLRKSTLCTPPLNEQQKIADYLDKVCGEVDEMIALQEQMIEELKAYKQSVITEAVTKGLNPNAPMRDSGIDWIGEIPEHWKVTKIKLIAKTNSGSTPKSISDGEDSNIIWIRTTDINDDNVIDSSLHLTKEEYASASCPMLDKGTCVVAMYGGGGTIGKCGFLDCRATINQALCSMEVSNLYYSRYLFCVLKAIRYYWMKFAVGTRKDPNINQEIVKNMIVTMPPLSEQQAIASYLDSKCSEIDALIAIKQQKIEELKDYKKSVIYEYVTGKKEVGG